MRTFPLVALGALALLLSAGCDEKRAAPTGPVADTVSPADSPVAYKVLKDELVNGTAEYHVIIDPSVKHDAVDDLTKFLYRHLMKRREDPPSGVAAYVYTQEEQYKTPPRTPQASIVKRPSDLGPAFENKVPKEFGQEVEEALKWNERIDKNFKIATKLERDDAQKSLTLTVPYTEPGQDQWAETLSYNQAIQTFTDSAQALFNNVAEMRGMTFIGVWKDKEVLRVNNLTRADYTALKLSEIDERIGSHHGRIFLQLQTGKEANLAADKANLAASKQNAALIAKEYKAMLAPLKGKVTVSPTLK